MTGYLFPRIPYGDVRSGFIREEIRTGSFEDLAHRRYVNCLVHVESCTRDDGPTPGSGLDAACARFVLWRVATIYPDAFDAVREEFDAETRVERTNTWNGEDDEEARRRWALRHRNEWTTAQGGRLEPDPTSVSDTPIDDRPYFDTFRFPTIAYHELESTFILNLIRDGSFDDVDHRKYVNQLVDVEALTRAPKRLDNGGYPSIRPWVVAAKYPEEFDRIRVDLDEPTREELGSGMDSSLVEDIAERTAEHRRAWKAVRRDVD